MVLENTAGVQDGAGGTILKVKGIVAHGARPGEFQKTIGSPPPLSES